MLEINVKEARSNLSTLLDRVEKGEEIIITRRGKRVAWYHNSQSFFPLRHNPTYFTFNMKPVNL